MPVNIATSPGFSSMLINAGEIENKGVELVLSASIIQSKSGFNCDMTINWAKNKNRVNELHGDLESLWISDMWSTYVETRPGQNSGAPAWATPL